MQPGVQEMLQKVMPPNVHLYLFTPPSPTFYNFVGAKQTTMADKYQNKYRIQSARLPSWNYSSNAAYFITICTVNREHYFGEIVQHNMQLSEIGKRANDNWLDIPNPFSFVVLDAFVIMPINGIQIN